MPGMSENPFDKVFLVTPAGGDDAMTERLTEKASYHFDAELCGPWPKPWSWPRPTPAAACWSAAAKPPHWKLPLLAEK